MFPPQSAWRPPSESPSFRDAKRIAIDIETCDPTLEELGPGVRRGAFIAGVSIGIDDGPAWYMPFGHLDDSENLEKDMVVDYLEYECRHFKGEVVGANLIYDLDFLAEELITFPNAKAFMDVQVAEALIDENQRSRSLETISHKYLLHGKDETLLTEAARAYYLNKKKDLWKLPARFVGPYAESDVRNPLDILRQQETIIAKQYLDNIWRLEQKVTPVILKMIRNGVRVDEERLEACRVYFERREEECYVAIKKLTGHDLRGNINATARLAAVLRERNVVLPKTEKSGADSVTKEVLDALDDPVAELIRQAKKFNKGTNTFYNSVKTRLVGDRLHPNFHQCVSDEGGTVTGRLSSSNPNIQQQPHHDEEIGTMWRSIYVPDTGWLWAKNDYKAQEPRLFLSYAALIGARGARQMAQRYREDPTADPYQMLCPDLPKKHVKIIYLGRGYGMGDTKLRMSVEKALRDTGVTEGVDEKVSTILYQFGISAPYFNDLTRSVTDRAVKNGFIKTLLGRRCRFPGGEFTHKATNRLIQGSAADMTKKAMVDLDAAGWTPHFQVHDELDFSVPNVEAANTIKRIMEDAVHLEVPVVCETTTGPSWGECA